MGKETKGLSQGTSQLFNIYQAILNDATMAIPGSAAGTTAVSVWQAKRQEIVKAKDAGKGAGALDYDEALAVYDAFDMFFAKAQEAKLFDGVSKLEDIKSEEDIKALNKRVEEFNKNIYSLNNKLLHVRGFSNPLSGGWAHVSDVSSVAYFLNNNMENGAQVSQSQEIVLLQQYVKQAVTQLKTQDIPADVYDSLTRHMDSNSESVKTLVSGISTALMEKLENISSIVDALGRDTKTISFKDFVKDPKNVEEFNNTLLKDLFAELASIKTALNEVSALKAPVSGEATVGSINSIIAAINTHSDTLNGRLGRDVVKAFSKTTGEIANIVKNAKNELKDMIAGLSAEFDENTSQILLKVTSLEDKIAGLSQQIKDHDTHIYDIIDFHNENLIRTEETVNRIESLLKAVDGKTDKLPDEVLAKLKVTLANLPKDVAKEVTEALTSTTSGSGSGTPKKGLSKKTKIAILIAAIIGGGALLSTLGVTVADFVVDKNGNGIEITATDIENSQLSYFAAQLNEASRIAANDISSFEDFVKSISVDESGVKITIPATIEGQQDIVFDTSNIQGKFDYTNAVIAQYNSANVNDYNSVNLLIDAFAKDDNNIEYSSTDSMRVMYSSYQKGNSYDSIHGEIVEKYESLEGNGAGSSEGKTDSQMLVAIAQSGGNVTDYTGKINDLYKVHFPEGTATSIEDKIEAIKNIEKESHTQADIDKMNNYDTIHGSIVSKYEEIKGEGSSKDVKDEDMLAEIAKKDPSAVVDYSGAIDTVYKTHFGENAGEGLTVQQKLDAIGKIEKESHSQDDIKTDEEKQQLEDYGKLYSQLVKEYETIKGSGSSKDVGTLDMLKAVTQDGNNKYTGVVDEIYKEVFGDSADNSLSTDKKIEAIKAVEIEQHTGDVAQQLSDYSALHTQLVTGYEGLYGEGSSQGKTDAELLETVLTNSNLQTYKDLCDAVNKLYSEKLPKGTATDVLTKIEELGNYIQKLVDDLDLSEKDKKKIVSDLLSAAGLNVSGDLNKDLKQLYAIFGLSYAENENGNTNQDQPNIGFDFN